MKLFKDSNNSLFAYETDGSQDHLIASNLIQITEEEANQIRKSLLVPLSDEDKKAIKRKAFEKEADPLFFKAQRGEATMQEWLDKVEEIRNRVI